VSGLQQRRKIREQRRQSKAGVIRPEISPRLVEIADGTGAIARQGSRFADGGEDAQDQRCSRGAFGRNRLCAVTSAAAADCVESADTGAHCRSSPAGRLLRRGIDRWPVGQQRMDPTCLNADSAGNTCPLGGAAASDRLRHQTIPPFRLGVGPGGNLWRIHWQVSRNGWSASEATFAQADNKNDRRYSGTLTAGGLAPRSAHRSGRLGRRDSRPCRISDDRACLCS